MGRRLGSGGTGCEQGQQKTMTLRSATIRLAHQQESLREHLLPLLRVAAERASGAPDILYHLTSHKGFKLNPAYQPIEGVGVPHHGAPGIFLTDTPAFWKPWRRGKIYVVVLDVSRLSGGSYAEKSKEGEPFDFYRPREGAYPEFWVRPEGFSRMRVIEVLPWAEAVAKYENPGWGDWKTK